MQLEQELLEREYKDKIERIFIDNNLDAFITDIEYDHKKSFVYEYLENKDILIIGFCLEASMEIKDREINTVSKGEVFYFRPEKDFEISFSKNSFLYYIMDLNSFENSLYCKNCKKRDKLTSNHHLDSICKRGELYIKKAPYMVNSCIDEIKRIKRIEKDDFLEYANIKGQLFNYLTCLLRLRLKRGSWEKGRQCESQRCKRHRVAEAKKIIMDNLDKHISVKELAERLDISTYILQKSFKKIEDSTVYEFILKVKMDNSKMRLRKTNLSIMEISQRAGYENSSKFSTAFKNMNGYTPSQYREKMED